MAWVAVAIGGAALVGGAASYLGAQKQAGAAKDAAQMQKDQAGVNRQDQLPYIQSGYGALGKLNTLMGINGVPSSAPTTPASNPINGGTGVNNGITNWGGNPLNPQGKPIAGPVSERKTTQPVNPQLRNILAIRANNGDAQAAQLMKVIS